jgi:hypothetical protein
MPTKAGGSFAKKFDYFGTAQLATNRYAPIRADTVDLENVLCEINPDRRNLHGEWLLSVGAQQRPQFGTQCRERGPSTPSGQAAVCACRRGWNGGFVQNFR